MSETGSNCPICGGENHDPCPWEELASEYCISQSHSDPVNGSDWLSNPTHDLYARCLRLEAKVKQLDGMIDAEHEMNEGCLKENAALQQHLDDLLPMRGLVNESEHDDPRLWGETYKIAAKRLQKELAIKVIQLAESRWTGESRNAADVLAREVSAMPLPDTKETG